jgi:ABC-type spermidine/putrescine transport system permease subunit I
VQDISEMTVRWVWFLVIPLLISLALALGTQFIFLEKSFFLELGLGQTGAFVGLHNYVVALHNKLYLSSIATTLRVSAFATIGCLLLAYPLAYSIARATGRWAMFMLSGVLLTSLVSAPIKVLGLIIIFSQESALNRFLLWSGVLDAPLRLLGTELGVVVGLIYYSLAFAVLLLYSVIRTIPVTLEEAAASLGASAWSTFRRVTLPVIAPGIFAGSVYAFMVSFGDVPISLFLAGPDTVTFPVEIFHSMEIDFDARILSSSTLVMLFGLILLLLVQKVIGIDGFARSQAGAVG